MTLKDLSELEWKYQCSKTQMRPDYVPKTKFSDTTANGLTKAVITFLTLHGHQAERINTTGRYIDDSKIVTDAVGFKRVLGRGKYIPSTSTRGSADISSTINVKGIGLSVKFEVKMKDRQSEHQKIYEQDIKKAGGQYYIVHNFPEFIEYYNKVLTSLDK